MTSIDEDSLAALRADLGTNGIKSLVDEPMAGHTTLRVGGPADLFARPRSVGEFKTCVEVARRHGVPCKVVGWGSNLLVRDSGIRGLVVHTGALRGCKVLDDGCVTAECGVSLPWLSRTAAKRGLAGVEFGLGIPGTIGGGTLMNAGCYGQELKDVVTQVRILDSELRQSVLHNDELAFGYRTSRLRGSDDTILYVDMQLAPGGDPAEIEAATQEKLNKKRASQPMAHHSAGSVFIPPPGDYASRLIDAAGLKGVRCGGAVVSTKHAGFVVNDQDASAEDVLRLVDIVREKVYKEFEVQLELEIEIVGD